MKKLFLRGLFAFGCIGLLTVSAVMHYIAVFLHADGLNGLNTYVQFETKALPILYQYIAAHVIAVLSLIIVMFLLRKDESIINTGMLFVLLNVFALLLSLFVPILWFITVVVNAYVIYMVSIHRKTN